MKKLLLFLTLIFSIFACGCSTVKQQSTLDKIKDRDVLIVGTQFDIKPFGYKEKNEIKGFDIDIAKQIAKNILGNENKIKFVEVTSETRISKLMSEEVDIVVATMTDNQQRREIIDFSEPYYVSGQAVMCKKNSQVTSLVDLSNHTTAVVVGTTAEKTLRSIYNKSNIKRFKTYTEAFNAVKASSDTCLITDEAILQGLVMDNDGYEIFNKKLTIEPYAVAFRKDEPELKNYINYTMSELKNTGELEKLGKKWIK